MRACVFVHATNALANANNFIAAINAVLGLPRDGRDRFGNTVAGKGITTTWGTPIPLPGDSTKYAVIFRNKLQDLTLPAAENKIVNGVDSANGATSILVAFSLTQTQYDNFKAKLLTSEILDPTWLMPDGEPGI